MNKPQNIKSFDDLRNSIPQLHKFSHEAMATTFEIFVQTDDPAYTKKAALAAFQELDILENLLSRYIENSNISRINNLTQGRTAKLDLQTFECLSLAKDISSLTKGAFDPTIGLLYDCWLDEDNNLLEPTPSQLSSARKNTGMNLLELDQTDYTAKLLSDNIRVDLGAIGKGYALDQIARLLKDWSIDKALLHGGFSTLLAMAPPKDKTGWPVTISSPWQSHKNLAQLYLANRSLSISGLLKGPHIIDPRTAQPLKTKKMTWASSQTAAKTDALSTAFMVMTLDEIKEFCTENPYVLAVTVTKDQPENIIYFGPWEKTSD
ncbi:MAG: FAD:protein FMN transferase [Planctomycetota bacterium]|jgi:thiamine biosynthesis lipoprotein